MSDTFVAYQGSQRPLGSHKSFRDNGVGLGMSAEDVEALMAKFERQDDEKDWKKKTWSRAFVESTLQNFKWYNPQKDVPNAPSLCKAWTYYEHITLARHFVGDQTTDGDALARAEPGEQEEDTELYSFIQTPESALNEWGIGVGIYFSMVRSVSLILLLAGLINIPNILHYRSAEYNGEGGQAGLWPIFTLQGTAICTDREWVVCTDCGAEERISQWNSEDGRNRYAFEQNDQDTNITFVHKTRCKGAQLEQGMVNFATLIFLIIAFGLMALYQRKREIRFDEDKSTSTDYSVKVSNPPPDAYDPDKWHDFFEQFASKQVTFVTVALDNAELLRILYVRRLFIDKLRRRLPTGTDMDNEEEVDRAIEAYLERHKKRHVGCLEKFFFCLVVPFLRPFNFFLPVDVLRDRIKEWGEKAKVALKKEYKVTKVFVTFETEEGQRAALAALDCSTLDVFRQNKNAVASNARFQDKVLRVTQPAEPNSIRWLDLQVPVYKRYLTRLFFLGIIFGLIGLSGFVINLVRHRVRSIWYGVVVASFNYVVPLVARILVIFEQHGNEGSAQKSMYAKITIFRWANGVLLTLIVTPLASYLGEGSQELLPAINAVLLSEMVITPLLRIVDIMGFFRKHILAPRAETQEQMNKMFSGTYYNIGERYTDLSKVLFLVIFYSSINPNTFFIGSATLFIQYYADKYCLMRVWKSAPFIGTEISSFSRKYFISTALFIMAVVSSYFWAQYPYDNLCTPPDPTGGYEGKTYEVRFANDTKGSVTVEADDEVVWCQQNALEIPGLAFPAVPGNLQGEIIDGKTWMTSSQETLASIYGWSSVVVFFGWIVIFFGTFIVSLLRSCCVGTNSGPEAKDNKIDFSTVQEINAYVPQIIDPNLSFPILACDVDSIDQNLIGWNDPHRSYDFHNMLYDVPWPGMKRSRKINENTRRMTHISQHAKYQKDNREEGRDVDTLPGKSPIFSIVKHWPPEWKKNSDMTPRPVVQL